MPSTRPNRDPSLRSTASRVRLVGAAAILAVLVLYVLADAFEFPFLREGFHAEPTIVGALGGFFVALVLPELAAILPGIKPRESDDDPEQPAR